jgi:peptide deformylase
VAGEDALRDERFAAAFAQIRQYGDPVLRTPAMAVTDFDAGLSAEAERMAVILLDVGGAGLAAPQVGRLSRLVVMRVDEAGRDLRALCNPVIAWRDDETAVALEGCLSMPAVAVEVARAVAVRVEATDLAGEAVELELTGDPARISQHEIDHLDGILMLDRVGPEQRREALRTLRAGG